VKLMSGLGKTLIINTGSSSLKYRLYENDKIIIDKSIEEIKDYNKAVEIVIRDIKRYDLGSINKIAHRIVHGMNYSSPKIINPKLLKELKKLIVLAPLHMIPAIEVIEVIEVFMKKLKAKNVACFDTSFHQTIPEIANMYAIPIKLTKKYQIKRYGFHGIAHEWMFRKVEKINKKKYSRIITCQLGNGASVCAIKNGKSVDTSMGFTPLEGLMMGTRSGDLDPAIIEFLCKNEKKRVDEITNILQKESGLKGIANESDVRKLLERERKGDKIAKLALDMFAYRVKKYIGSYIAVLGGVDLIVLSGGIARSFKMRERILSGLEEFGIKLNNNNIGGKISKGKVSIYVLEADEQEQIFEISKKI